MTKSLTVQFRADVRAIMGQPMSCWRCHSGAGDVEGTD